MHGIQGLIQRSGGAPHYRIGAEYGPGVSGRGVFLIKMKPCGAGDAGQRHAVVDDEDSAPGSQTSRSSAARGTSSSREACLSWSWTTSTRHSRLNARDEVRSRVGHKEQPGSVEGIPTSHTPTYSGVQATTSSRREKWRAGFVAGSSTPIWAVISSVSTSASALCKGHITW